MMDDLDRVKAEGSDIVYLGNCCVLDHAPDDEDKRSLPEILNNMMPAWELEGMAHNAYHGELFEGVCRVMAAGMKRPEVVIIPINLRSFSSSWDEKPEYQFSKMNYLLENDRVCQRSALRPLIMFNYIDLNPIT